MEFAHPIHEETYRRVAENLPELFEDPFQDGEDGHFYVRYGSTVLEIAVEPYGPQEATVKITGYCVQGTNVTERLLVYLLEVNHTLPMGGFSAVGEDVFFSLSLYGRELSPSQLLSAIAFVANTTDEFDDRLAAEHGGQTAIERIQDTGGRKRRDARRQTVPDSASETGVHPITAIEPS